MMITNKLNTTEHRNNCAILHIAFQGVCRAPRSKKWNFKTQCLQNFRTI